ncbi:MAG TPA: hypothetical protein VIS74_05560 [Chthoniobacterales bacterium]
MTLVRVGAFFLVWMASTLAEDRVQCVEMDAITQISVKSKSRPLVPGTTQWLKPGGPHAFKVECLERQPRLYRLKLELYESGQALAAAEVLIGRDQPITLRSPEKTWRVWVE